MTTQEVFINKNYQMRAGWRVLIFIVAFILISMPSVYLGLLFTKFLEFPKEYNEIIVKFLTTIIPLGLSFFLLKKLDNRSTDYLGLKTDCAGFIELAWGLLIGFVMLTIAVLIPYAMGYVSLQFATEPPSYFFSGLAFNLLLFIVVGFNEEILFRGYIFQATGEGLGFVGATLLYSLLFGAAHLGNPNVSLFGIINIVLAGVLLSLAYIKTRALWMPIGIHIAWNFTQGYIW
ncbi:MAG TPA: type II CAAX endopeptidase family protein [bacterium]|nr:type II CAAX endopeptidase family protein [bacterium]